MVKAICSGIQKKWRYSVRGLSTAIFFLLFFIFSMSTVVVAHEEGEVELESPCPDSAPVRTFEVKALDLTEGGNPIVYNNWGDKDNFGNPNGSQVFTLESQTYNDASGWSISTGPNGPNKYNNAEIVKSITNTTPAYEIQPLTLRCNVGDCIKIELTNVNVGTTASGASILIRRAQYNVLQPEGNLVGQNESPAVVAPTGNHTYVFYIEDKAENQGAYHISNEENPIAEIIYGGLWGALIAEPKGSRYLASLNPLNTTSGSVFLEGFDPENPPDLTWNDWEAIIVPCIGVIKGESPSCDRLFNSLGAFGNGVSDDGNLGLNSGKTTNHQGAFREAVTYYHDGIFMGGGTLNDAKNKMGFPVPGVGGTSGLLLPIKGDKTDSGLWAWPNSAAGSDGGSTHGERYAYSTHAGVLGTRGWPIMGPSGPVAPLQPGGNNTSFNDDVFGSPDQDISHNVTFGKGMNYRSDPFSYMKAIEEDESLAYSSYSFGEPATPCVQAYLGDPMVWRVVHGAGEEHHIQHMHGFTRWPEQPYEDHGIDPISGELVKGDDGNPVLASRMYLRGIVEKDDNLAESLERSAAVLKQRKDVRPTASNIVDVTMNDRTG